ncbi:hypothetical protein IV203_021845 [Nitzschia inconspicua]|uniref:Uncharacterized protein n=1 Tax=Nitzschia inconspicua TaxID=303405 RepID=A0A9K3KHS4_9STRA|nr:hypothetical protein IV203_033449 [Nitzschia inconspicua]KAG7343837.1 hypothetical protein IV203_021845 [Nitzschia inconspicua]
MYHYAERVFGALATWQELSGRIKTNVIDFKEEAVQMVSETGREGGKRDRKAIVNFGTPSTKSTVGEEVVPLVEKFTGTPVDFLGEKWFYTTNRRPRVKILPPTVSENGEVRVCRPHRIRTRRHPAKMMYLGVVAAACPQLQKGFDGRVCLHRVSRTKTLARASRKNTRYSLSVDVDILQVIKSGEWIQLLVTEGMTAEAMLEEIKTHYDLDEYAL